MSAGATRDGLAAMVAAARDGASTPATTVGGDGAAARELFHAANSICSQKVRAVLAHHRLPYLSHGFSLPAGDAYRPSYVRLRMLGCAALGLPLADRHDGSTAIDAGGCDGVVVPTLVDWDAGEVLVDSKRICFRLDGLAPETARLRPPALAAAIDAELRVVDAFPNYQLLMGRPQGADAPHPDPAALGAFSRRKVAWCDRYLAQYADDPVLTAAYAAKRAKEQSAADHLFSPEAMAAALDRAEAGVRHLDRALAHGRGPWLFGDAPTMADLFWGLELLRLDNVGAGHFWADGRLPRVAAFLAAAEALPAIRTAVIDWPGARY